MLNSAQITMLVVAGIIAAFYLKYKITGSIKSEISLTGRLLNRAYPALALLACAGSLIAATVGVMAVADVLIQPSADEHAAVIAKNKYYRGKQATDYKIQARGSNMVYTESVSALFYNTVRTGDTINVQVTPLFGEWKKAKVVRDGEIVYSGRGSDIYAMAIMGVFFLLTLYSFRLYFRMRNHRTAGSIVFTFIILFELIPLKIIFSQELLSLEIWQKAFSLMI